MGKILSLLSSNVGLYLMTGLLALSLGLGALLRHSYVEQGLKAARITDLEDAQEALLEAREREVATLALRAKLDAASGLESAALAEKSERAIAKNRNWADQPLPKEVADAIR